MNSNIFKIFFCILFIVASCRPKVYINEKYNLGNVNELQQELRKYFHEKKTGKYIYPKLGATINLKKGMYNGEMSIIIEKDTLYYCVYQNNKPVRKYINVIYQEKGSMYLRVLPVKPKIDVGYGRGIFNIEHQKEGFWKDDFGSGNYIKGLKNGDWIDYYFNDVGAITTKTKTVYKNDTIVSKIVLEVRPTHKKIDGIIPNIDADSGFFNKKNQKDGFWEEENRRFGHYINGVKDGEWIDYEKVGDTIITTKTIYKKGVIISTVVDKY